ncbi:hypothetical protein COOONC_12034 [Cooperia oncophora]
MVNMDVIDAVNARLAACDGDHQGDDVNDVEANFNLPYTILRPQLAETIPLVNKSLPFPNDKTKSNKSLTVTLNFVHCMDAVNEKQFLSDFAEQTKETSISID